MAEIDDLAAFPSTLRAGTTEPGALYRRLPELVAIHDRTEAPSGLEPVLVFVDPPIVVCRTEGGALPPLGGATVTPVYALARRGAPAVPTGLVLVRFREGVAAAACGEALSREGFTIHGVLPYAPGAAWVKAASGGIPASLSGIARLEALPDVVHVEPQMARRAAAR